MLIDSHFHLNSSLYENKNEIYEESKNSGVESMVSIAFDFESSKENVELAKQYDNLYVSLGVHPDEEKTYDEKVKEYILENSKNPKVVAIGEIGLDYFHNKENKERQKEVFIQQILLAYECNLPIVLHIRDAINDAYEILKQYKDKIVGGVVHCYSGSVEMAEKFIDLGLFLGFNGVITFKNNVTAPKVIEKISLENILIETDAPYLTPEPFRGKRNSPKYVKYVAEKIAEIKGVSLEEVEKITCENARKMYFKMK